MDAHTQFDGVNICKYKQKTKEDIENETKLKDKIDLIKRFFAIAFSIGVADFLRKMFSLFNSSSFTLYSFLHLSTLFFIGMFITIGSWDGYFSSIESKPPKEKVLYLDIGIIISYMIFFIFIDKNYHWLFLVFCIFMLYIIWDFMKIKEYPDKYFHNKYKEEEKVPFFSMFSFYFNSLFYKEKLNYGPIITIFWTIPVLFNLSMVKYFNISCDYLYQFTLMFSTFSILIFYREDKKQKEEEGEEIGNFCFRGYKPLYRLSIIFLILITTWSFIFLFKNLTSNGIL